MQRLEGHGTEQIETFYLTHGRLSLTCACKQGLTAMRQCWRAHRHGQANMFRVVPGTPLWHAVASENASRISVGIAISDALADKILHRIVQARASAK
jgi:hypothetical protein